MPDFMSHHPGQFGFVGKICKDAAGQVNISARNGKRIDHRRIHDGEVPFQIRPVGNGDKLAPERLYVRL